MNATDFCPIIIGCRTLEQELTAAMEQTGCRYPVLWIESGLHNVPQRLCAAVQEAVDRCGGHTHVLMAMGFCGNSIAGVTTGAAPLILPRVDDCISLLLGSVQRRTALNKTGGTYFFTEGWLRGERTILAEYRHAVDEYGEELADEVFRDMLRNYEKAALIDTGCFDRSAAAEETKKIARTFSLQYCEVPGTLTYIKELLSGPWPEERFVRIPAHTQISGGDLRLPAG